MNSNPNPNSDLWRPSNLTYMIKANHHV